MPQPLRDVDVWLLVLCPLIVPCAGACASSDFGEVSAGPVEGEEGNVILTSARIS